MVQTRREKKTEETGALWLAVMREVLRGSGAAAAVTLLALLACALLVSNGAIGEEMMDRAVLAVCVLGSLTGGLLAVRRIGRSPLPVGLGVGLCLFLLLLSAGCLLSGSASVSNDGALILLSCCCGGAMAGVLGARPNRKRRRQRVKKSK